MCSTRVSVQPTRRKMSNLVHNFQVNSPNVEYKNDEIISHYTYNGPPKVTVKDDKSVVVEPQDVCTDTHFLKRNSIFHILTF